MQFHYVVYGLNLVATAPIPGMPSNGAAQPANVTVHWLGTDGLAEIEGRQIAYASAHPDRDGNPTLVVTKDEEGRYAFRYADDTRFLIAADGSQVTATWPANMTSEDTATYFLGPVMGFVARLRGKTSLHASSVRIGEGAIAIVGQAGAGKSTTAAALVQRGCPLLAEDVSVLDERGEQFHVLPGYPHIRLWPPSVELLFGSAEALPLITPNWDKRDFDVAALGLPFEERPTRLTKIYVLDERTDGAMPRAQSIEGQEAIISLVANTYVNYLHDEEARAAEFATLGRLVRSVPVQRLHAPSGANPLERLCDFIMADARAAEPIIAQRAGNGF